MDLQDPRLGLTQCLDAGMDGMGTQYEVIVVRDSRAQDELCVGLRCEFEFGTRRCEGHQLTLLQLVRNANRALTNSGPEDRMPRWRLIAPAFSSFQTDGEVVHRRQGLDRTCRVAVAADQHAHWSIDWNRLRRQINAL
jgi:hypothetical protein